MEVINSTSFLDESTGLLFHKLDHNNPNDSKMFDELNTWDSENIKRFLTPLSDEPLGTSLICGARWGSSLYSIQDANTHEMEVIGTTLLVPNAPINGYPDLKEFFYENKAMINQPPTDPSILSIKAALRLLNSNSRGLYIHALAVNPEKTGMGYGTDIYRIIAENCHQLNENKAPLCTMASINMFNNFSHRACANAGYQTLPNICDGYLKFYKMNKNEFTF